MNNSNSIATIKIEDNTFIISYASPTDHRLNYLKIQRVGNQPWMKNWFYIRDFDIGVETKDGWLATSTSITHNIEARTFLPQYRMAIKKFRKLLPFM